MACPRIVFGGGRLRAGVCTMHTLARWWGLAARHRQVGRQAGVDRPPRRPAALRPVELQLWPVNVGVSSALMCGRWVGVSCSVSLSVDGAWLAASTSAMVEDQLGLSSVYVLQPGRSKMCPVPAH